MSSAKVKCMLNIIREHFGPIVSQIAHQLINSSATLKLVCFLSKKPVHQIKECLKTLIQHNLVEYKINSRDQVEYELLSDNVIAMLRYSKYVLVGSYVDSKIGEYLVKEFILNGKLTIDDLLNKLIKRLSNDITVDTYELPKLIYDTFVKFVNQDYIVNGERSKKVETVDFNRFRAPPKIKKEHGQESDDDEEQIMQRPAKKQKVNGNEAIIVESGVQVIWYLNNEQFDFHLRGEPADCVFRIEKS